MPTIKQIASLAGVSRGTVDRVLNNRPNVSKETRDKVNLIIQELNYIPNKDARALSVQRKCFKIAYIYSATESNAYFNDIIRGIKSRIREYDTQNITFSAKMIPYNEYEIFCEVLDKYINNGYQGFILSPVNCKDVGAKINSVIRQGISIVTCNTDNTYSDRLAYVGSNYYQSGVIASGLIALHNKNARVGVVHDGNPWLVKTERLNGFLDSIARSYSDIHVIDTIETHEDNYEAFHQVISMFQRNADIDTLFVSSSTVEGVCKALQYLKIEQQVKVFTFDLFPQIQEYLEEGRIQATIDQESFWQGRKATGLLLDNLINKTLPSQQYYYARSEICLRESLGLKSTNDTGVE